MLPGDENRVVMRDAHLDVAGKLDRAVHCHAAGIVAVEIQSESVILVVHECPPERWSVRPPPLHRVEQQIVPLDIQVVTEHGHLF